jgi:hypothetical protein
MTFENRSGVFFVRYGKPEELLPEAQRDLEAAVRGAGQAVGIVFVVAPAVQAVAHDVPEYWLGITSDKRVRIAAIAVVTPNPAVSVATRGFSTSNILKDTTVAVKPFNDEAQAASWVAAEVAAARKKG